MQSNFEFRERVLKTFVKMKSQRYKDTMIQSTETIQMTFKWRK